MFHAVTINEDKELPAWHSDWFKTYTIGLLLLDLEKPWIVKGMYGEPLMVPEEPCILRDPLRASRLCGKPDGY